MRGSLSRSGFRRAVASGLTPSTALKLFEQVADLALRVLAPLVASRALDLQRGEVVVLRGPGRHQPVAELAHEVVHRALAPRQSEVDRTVPGAEVPDLLW